MTLPTEPIFIQIGHRRYEVASFKQASVMFCVARDACGKGASQTPSPLNAKSDAASAGLATQGVDHMTTQYAANASGTRFQIEETPVGHWRATQAEGTERNYAGIPASFTAPTRKQLLAQLSRHHSN